MFNKAVTSNTTTILFDHDGTLINSECVHFELWKQVASRYNVEIDEHFYNTVMAGVPTPQNALDVIAQYNLNVEPDVLEAQKLALLFDYLEGQAFPLMPYASSIVKAVYDAGYTVGIVTGGNKASVYKTLESYQLAPYISCIVAVEDVDKSKPHPDCYLKAANALQVLPSQCVAIEDTHHGMSAAVAATMPCVAIPTAQSLNHDFSCATSQYENLQAWFDNEIGRSK